MKYLLLLTFQLIIAYCSNAQVSKPYYYFPVDPKGQALTDTTKGFITAKWAIVDMLELYYVSDKKGTIFVYFDNGNRVNLYTKFNDDPALMRNKNIYYLATLEYMDQHGFCLIGSTENILTFQRK